MCNEEKDESEEVEMRQAYQIIRFACSFGWSLSRSWHLDGTTNQAAGSIGRNEAGMRRVKNSKSI